MMINKVIKWLLFIVVCFILQTTLIKAIAVSGVRPDLLVVALFMVATKTGVMQGVYLGFFMGLTQDLYSPAILGQTALSYSVIGYIAGLFNDKVIKLDPLLKAVLLIMLFLINDTLVMAVQSLKSGSGMGIMFPELLFFSLPRAFYSLLFASIPFVWEVFIQPAVRRY